MLPSTLKADMESRKPTARPDPDRTESRLGSYVDRVSGASRLEDEGRPDHTYAKSSIWRPQNYLVKPCRYLFTPATGRRGPRPTPDRAVDVESVEEEPPVPLPRPPAPADPEPPDEEASCWAEKISKTGWSPVQVRILPKALRVLEDVRLHRLACRGRQDERFHVEEALEGGRSRLSHLLAGVGWDAGVTRWLHSLLMKHLAPVERADYLSLLGRLKRRAPGPVEAMTAPGPPGRAPPLPPVPPAGPPLDRQVGDALLDEKFSRLPHDPLFFLVPNSLECSRTERFAATVAQLRQMAQVHVVAHPPRARGATIQQGLDQMVAETRARLAEVRAGGGARPVVLIGWSVGAAIASLLAQLEPARALVCVGYPYRTLDGGGEHRQSTLSVSEATCPVMFVTGSRSRLSAPEDMEELRSHMRVPSQLVVVGGCDDRLAMGRPDRSALRVTQSMVDRSVVVEIYNFVGETLTQPALPPPRPPPRFPVPAVPCRRRLRDQLDVPAPKRPRPPRGPAPKLIVINSAKYASILPHHNYAARLQPAPGSRGWHRGGPPL